MRNMTRMILIFALTFTGACSSLRFPGVFRIDIPQGNIISAENVEKLKIGMTTRQVEYLMGSAMVQDPFHPDRQDYFYHLETGKGRLLKNHLTLYFDKGTLVKIDKSQYTDAKSMSDKVQQKLDSEADLKKQRKIFSAPEDAIPAK